MAIKLLVKNHLRKKQAVLAELVVKKQNLAENICVLFVRMQAY